MKEKKKNKGFETVLNVRSIVFRLIFFEDALKFRYLFRK